MLKAIKLGFMLIATVAFIAGCASTSDTVEPVEVESTAEASPAPAPAPAPVAAPEPESAPVFEKVEGPVLENTFYFEFDQSTLTAEARAALLAQAAYLKANPRSIRLAGHADERGTREYNVALGERRALAVRNFLRFEGVTSPIEVVSYGEERPFSYETTEKAYSLNRRVELD